MTTMTIACPACGSQRKLEENEMGQKLRCGCGMSFAASPVFAVPDEGGPGAWLGKLSKISGSKKSWLKRAGLALVVFGVTVGAAIWLMNRPSATTTPEGGGELAANGSPAPAPPVDPVPAPTDPTPPDPPPPKPVDPVTPPPQPPAPPPPAKPVASLSAVTLWDAFDLNPEDAASRYVGKLVEVTARGKVATDTFGKTYFGAEVVKPQAKPNRRLTPDEQRWEKEGYPPNVRLYLAPGQASAVEALPPGQTITFRGTVVGRKDRENVYRGYIVELQDSTIATDAK